MDDLESLTIRLPADIAQLIRAKVDAGEYASDSDVVCQALQSWQVQETRAERLSAIRAKLAASRADTGPSFSGQEIGKFFEQRYQKAMAARIVRG